jgi:low affinity Fe/Cu permease
VTVRDAFRTVAHATACAIGSPYAFATAVLVIVIWAATGPAFHYSDTWQLIINTGTTVVTFLVVFMIQNTQNRDSRAIHLKLDELIHAVDTARNRMVDIEDVSDEELAELAREFRRVRNEPDARQTAARSVAVRPPQPQPQPQDDAARVPTQHRSRERAAPRKRQRHDTPRRPARR